MTDKNLRRDSVDEMLGHGELSVRVAAVRISAAMRRCELDVVHRGEALVLHLSWQDGEIGVWSSPDSQLHDRWPHLFNRNSALIASSFGVALTLLAAWVRDGHGPTLPIDMSEEEAIQVSRRALCPGELTSV